MADRIKPEELRPNLRKLVKGKTFKERQRNYERLVKAIETLGI